MEWEARAEGLIRSVDNNSRYMKKEANELASFFYFYAKQKQCEVSIFSSCYRAHIKMSRIHVVKK
ncbi:hypothetical protein GCM10007932_31800 [Vibrio penaeicida]|uniref:Uncharacterized protein n=1 Tax=Vibrio penaeicida TaxID=104609 RepID=A0AAV5NTR7_9VIBR|nr:hypothetical protein GCM10007932_31800 [Vibrio penaeicida]